MHPYDATRFSPPAPLASATVRQSASLTAAPVLLLLDTGADVTLLPRSPVFSLGETASVGDFELIGFDGTRSISSAVDLELVFLKRVFKGRFLLIDQEWGILGRDVLNHLTLVFDGPQGFWDEK